MDKNELEMRAGDFGWIVCADALAREITTLRDITAVLRSEALEEHQVRFRLRERRDQFTPRPSPSQ